MWSANIIAMLGFVSFVFGIIGIISLVYYSQIQFIPLNFFTAIKNLAWYFVIIQASLFSIICILGILPVVIQFFLLAKINTNKHVHVMLLGTIALCTIPSHIFYSDTGSAIYLAFVPFFCYPILIAAGFIFILLLFIDLILKKQTSNKSLVKNKCYKFIVNIFFWYSIIIFILAFSTAYKLHQI